MQSRNAAAAWTGLALAPAVIGALSLLAANAAAETPEKEGPAKNQITVGVSVRNDTSPPLRDIPVAPVALQPQHVMREPLGFHGRISSEPDPVVQSSLAPAAMPSPILNFAGIPFPGVACNCAPPDTDGEVGATQYLQMVNQGIQVFNKTTGASVLGPIDIQTLWAGFGGVCETSGFGDPIVVYDQLANRWVVSQFAGGSVPTDECVAVSQTSDATGAWFRYDFNLGTNFFDYPKLSVWPDAYYMSMNVFNTAGTIYLGPQPYAMNRAAMLTGAPATFITPGLQPTALGALLPGDLDGSVLPPAGAPNPWLSTELPNWQLFRFHVDFVTPANSTFTLGGSLVPAPYTTLSAGVPQLGTGDLLDNLADRPMFRLAYRRFADNHEALVGNLTVSSGGVAGVRWWEINNATSGAPAFAQQGTYQPDSTWRWMGSAAMDFVGDIAVGFSASSASINPQVRYAGRLPSDPAGTLGQGEATLHAGTGSQTATNGRWGDYSDMTVDPVDDCTFWYTTEYYDTTSSFNWRTRIGNFKFPNCSLAPTFTLGVTPASLDVCSPTSGVYTVNVTGVSGFTNPVTLSATGNPAGTTVGFSVNPVIPTGSSILTIGNMAAAAAGSYTINVQGQSPDPITQNQNATLNVFTGAPGTPGLLTPANGAISQPLSPTFTWSAATSASTYTLEIATDAGFGSIVHTASGLTTTTYNGATLNSNTTYFWRVRAANPCAPGSNSSVFSFTTLAVCQVGSNYTTGASAGTIVPGVVDSGNHCDDCTTNVALPFPVAIYDQVFSSVNVASNGSAQFVSTNTAFTNVCPLPVAAFNTTIYPHWDDLRTDAQTGCAAYPGGLCGIFTDTTGSAPNRIFHIEWRAVYFSSTTTTANFELRLHEDSPQFEVVYGTLAGGGTSATVGVQRDTGSLFTQFSCNTAVPNNTQVNYTCTLVPVDLMGFSVQ